MRWPRRSNESVTNPTFHHAPPPTPRGEDIAAQREALRQQRLDRQAAVFTNWMGDCVIPRIDDEIRVIGSNSHAYNLGGQEIKGPDSSSATIGNDGDRVFVSTRDPLLTVTVDRYYSANGYGVTVKTIPAEPDPRLRYIPGVPVMSHTHWSIQIMPPGVE